MEKRIVAAYCIMLAGITGVILSLYFVAMGRNLELADAAARQSSYVLEVGTGRGLIYDRYLEPMVCRNSRRVLAAAPSAETAEELSSLLLPEYMEDGAALISQGKPFIISGDMLRDGTKKSEPSAQPESGAEKAETNVIKTAAEWAAARLDDMLGLSEAMSGDTDGAVLEFSVPVRYSEEQPALHLIGYTDSSGGVCGIEEGYNELLESMGGSITVKYQVDACGSMLPGSTAQVEDAVTGERDGVVLTIDSRLQCAAEDALSSIEKGAAVVMDVDTGEILAMASVPGYDANDIETALDSGDSPFINRALSPYNLGSVFKTVVAAAALEAGWDTSYTYDCPGYYELNGQIYHCHRLVGHGETDMHKAVEQSCNPYFINLGQHIGAQRLCAMAEAFGFGKAVKLAEGVVSAAGSLPEASEVDAGELANLSFGQGKLTATPVQVAQMMSIVASGGMWVSPTVIKGVTEDGVTVEAYRSEAPAKRVISEDTAATLRRLLIDTVEEGSGTSARPLTGGAGGKTASAQTGTYDSSGDEIVHAWFAGFYPAEEPKYAIVIFSEGGGAGGGVPAEAFAAFCDAAAEIDAKRNVTPRATGLR